MAQMAVYDLSCSTLNDFPMSGPMRAATYTQKCWYEMFSEGKDAHLCFGDLQLFLDSAQFIGLKLCIIFDKKIFIKRQSVNQADRK